MHKELVIAICTSISLFISFPVIVFLSVISCAAYSRTKAWDKARNQRTLSLEGQPLVERNNNSSTDNNGDSDSEFDDTDDEAERVERKAQDAADAADAFLTFGQKFRKEWPRAWRDECWSDKAEIAKKKEERRELAKAVAKELERRERRRARDVEREGGAEDLPPYKKA
ncbi:hypothetical protein IQ07DRAFT_588653 [Pyrenochaeta sp. DS3sAY3a]|nr:hypothetical protein IQ07DRAFT_588653 [Pyrenochaeta sp. DS3sAY3a]